MYPRGWHKQSDVVVVGKAASNDFVEMNAKTRVWLLMGECTQDIRYGGGRLKRQSVIINGIMMSRSGRLRARKINK